MHPVLEGIVRQGRIASAYLLLGPAGSSKSEDALLFAQRLSCAEVDRLSVVPDGSSIKIEQIRELLRLITYGPAKSDYLSVLLEPADLLTAEAAAALLKTLEEPPRRVVFILVAEQQEALPTTLISRCQRIIFAEKFVSWQPQPGWEEYYQQFKGLLERSFSVSGALRFAEKLSREEKLEELLYDLIYFAKEKEGRIKEARIWLEAARNIKKKANPKLALEVAALKMTNYGETAIKVSN